MSETEATGKPEKAIQDLDYSVIIYCWLKAYALAVVLNPMGLVFLFTLALTLFDGSSFVGNLGFAAAIYVVGLLLAWPFFAPAIPLSIIGAILVKRAGETRLKVYLLSGLAIAFGSVLIGFAVGHTLYGNAIAPEDDLSFMLEYGFIGFINGLFLGALADWFPNFSESILAAVNMFWLTSIITALLLGLPPGAIGGYLFHRFLMRVEE